MTKKEKIDLVISLALGRSPLTEDCVNMLSTLTHAELITKHGLNENQTNLIMTWCKHESQRLFEASYNVNKDS